MADYYYPLKTKVVKILKLSYSYIYIYKHTNKLMSATKKIVSKIHIF